MFFGKSPKEKAENDFNKAEHLFEALQYKKAGKYYESAGDTFYEIKDFSSAELSFLNAAKSYIKEERHINVLNSLRKASNCSLQLNNYAYSQKVFEKALIYTKKLSKGKEKHSFYIIFSVLYYLCALIKGEPEKGVNLIKKIQKRINKDYFKVHSLIHFITNLTIAIRDKNESYLEKIINDFNEIELNQVERELAQIAILLVYMQVSISPEVVLDQEQWTIKDLIGLRIKVDETSFNSIKQNLFFEFQIKEFKILKVSIGHSDNLTIKNKPEFPLDISLQKGFDMDFELKPQFQKDISFIGPIKIQYEINGKYIGYFENRNEFNLTLLSPPTHLDVSIKNLKPPLIDKTFPLEILIENHSDSEARNLEITLTLPEPLKLMRGTLEKQIYSLGTNESINWKISAKPIEAGDFEIIGDIKYSDPDQNILKERKIFPISIKM